jgi:hypothetical protein
MTGMPSLREKAETFFSQKKILLLVSVLAALASRGLVSQGSPAPGSTADSAPNELRVICRYNPPLQTGMASQSRPWRVGDSLSRTILLSDKRTPFQNLQKKEIQTGGGFYNREGVRTDSNEQVFSILTPVEVSILTASSNSQTPATSNSINNFMIKESVQFVRDGDGLIPPPAVKLVRSSEEIRILCEVDERVTIASIGQSEGQDLEQHAMQSFSRNYLALILWTAGSLLLLAGLAYMLRAYIKGRPAREVPPPEIPLARHLELYITELQECRNKLVLARPQVRPMVSRMDKATRSFLEGVFKIELEGQTWRSLFQELEFHEVVLPGHSTGILKQVFGSWERVLYGSSGDSEETVLSALIEDAALLTTWSRELMASLSTQPVDQNRQSERQSAETHGSSQPADNMPEQSIKSLEAPPSRPLLSDNREAENEL